MQDLLKEDDFIKQTPYNPKKSFSVFYLIAFAQLVLFIIWIAIVDPGSAYMVITAFTLTLVMPFIMVFYGKNSKARLRTIAIGIFISLALFYFPLILFALYGGSGIEAITAALLVFLINYVACTGIILRIVYKKQKRINIIQP